MYSNKGQVSRSLTSMRSAVVFFFLVAFAIILPSQSAWSQSLAARVGLLGPAEEPRFSQIASGLKQGFRELGYRDDAIRIVEGRTRRGDEANARATIHAIAGQNVTAFQTGPLLRPARETARQPRIVFITPGDPWRGLSRVARPGGT
jgi:hypothetical protein